MHRVLSKYGDVVDVFIHVKGTRSGKRFGYICYKRAEIFNACSQKLIEFRWRMEPYVQMLHGRDVITNLFQQFTEYGLVDVKVSQLGVDSVLVNFITAEYMQSFCQDFLTWIKSTFWVLKSWDRGHHKTSRNCWVKVKGIPPQACSNDFCRLAAVIVGRLVEVAPETEQKRRVDFANRHALGNLNATESGDAIDEVVKPSLEGLRHEVAKGKFTKSIEVDPNVGLAGDNHDPFRLMGIIERISPRKGASSSVNPELPIPSEVSPPALMTNGVSGGNQGSTLHSKPIRISNSVATLAFYGDPEKLDKLTPQQAQQPKNNIPYSYKGPFAPSYKGPFPYAGISQSPSTASTAATLTFE
ncbi:hypothetical protein Tsubulata_016764 [Turnera subulata]|uniref:RRM domain-containing protein n=1 Tax=Turnera subulata TaxID=218843 RepID=A0A9Q0FBD3_9ROSI|nr:hypothetical protein Tsubulata_016764 [Turnera subulata]